MTVTNFKADYRIIELRGEPATLGRTLAGMLAHRPGPFRPNPWEDDREFLRRCATLLRSVWQPLWEEVATFAESLGLPPERGLFIRAGSLPMGCSTAVWRLPDGQVFAGRNYDFYERMPTRHLLITEPRYGLAHIGMNGGLAGGRYDGVNERGLFVSLHKVMADRPAAYLPGIPYHLFPRLALELCADVEEAERLFVDLPHLAPFNYLLADPSGAMVKLECYPGRAVGVLSGAQTLAVTNHYEHPSLAPLQGNRALHKSQCRKTALQQQPVGGDPWQALAAALSDHDSDACSHREYSTTLWSGRFDLTGRRVAYAFGPPCSNQYCEFDWPGARGTRNA